MNYLEIFGLLLVFFFITNKFLISKKIFIDPKHNSYHKSFLKNTGDTPFSGGIIILFACLFFLPFEFPFLIFFIFSLFIIGLLSDLKKLNSPALRLLLQLLTIVLFLYFQNLNLAETRIMILDSLLRNTYFNLFFTTFCILIIINGTNFMDGANTLVLGYYF